MVSQQLQELFHQAHHAGPLDQATHQGTGGVPGRGPYIRLLLCVEAGVITTARFLTYGCPAAIACSEALCRWVEGHAVMELGEITPEWLDRRVGGVPEGKEHCPALAADAWRSVAPVDGPGCHRARPPG